MEFEIICNISYAELFWDDMRVRMEYEESYCAKGDMMFRMAYSDGTILVIISSMEYSDGMADEII